MIADGVEFVSKLNEIAIAALVVMVELGIAWGDLFS